VVPKQPSFCHTFIKLADFQNFLLVHSTRQIQQVIATDATK